MAMLDIILRTHATSNFRQGITRVTDILGGKPELAFRSLKSLVQSAALLYEKKVIDLRLTIVDDHSGEQFLAKVSKILEICPFNTRIVHTEERGNWCSIRTAFEMVRDNASDLVYFVEDDYLHATEALTEMILSYFMFVGHTDRPYVAMFPYDCPDRYKLNGVYPSLIVLGNTRHWRTVKQSTGTFLTPRQLLLDQWNIFLRFSEGVCDEAESINLIWEKHATLFSPVPSLVAHMHNEQDILFFDWKPLWDSL